MDRATPPHILTLILMAGLGAVSMSMHLPALTSMATWFDASYASVQLSVSGYLVGMAAIQLVIGPLSDRYGRRPVYLGSLLILIAASMACALAPTIELFLIFRMVQTLAAGGIVISRAVVRDMVPMERAASMIGYVTMGMTLLPMAGPILGGYLNDYLGWQSIFVAQAIFAVIVLATSFFDLGETHHNRSGSFAQQVRGWPDLFSSRRFWGYTMTATFTSGMYYSFLGGAPYVGSAILHLGAAEIGYLFAILGIGYLLGNYFSGRFAATAGVNFMMISGALASSVGIVISLAFFATGYQNALTFFGPLALIGLGNGLTLPSANAGIVSVRPHLAGSASGLGGAITIGGGAALAAIAAALLTPETGAFYLLSIMLASGLVSVLSTLYVRAIDLREGSLVEED